uniref:Septin-7 n=1 Tax=Eptatretus burgeri TaxID=7764 RepID=A0A8C4PYG8_EPTBU
MTENKEYVGFSALPGQVHRKTVKKGFEFTLMVVGESGLGKSTLINSLFLTDLYKDRKVPTAEERIEPTVSLEDHTMDFEEKGVRMRLTIIDTPGFADSVNNTNCWDTVVKCVEDRLGKYLHDESGLNRRHINDSRVHCCLYFISPFGRGLRPVDVACLTALHDRVNILPVIGKADCLTYTELRALKQQVRDDLERHSIRTYEFPDCDSEEEDEEYKIENQKLKESVPFAVVGSNMVVEVNGRKVRGRLYPWGIVEVENMLHSESATLRSVLVQTHTQDLKDSTAEHHYEAFRSQRLQMPNTKNGDIPPTTDEMIQQKEQELKKMQALLSNMQEKLNKQHVEDELQL